VPIFAPSCDYHSSLCFIAGAILHSGTAKFSIITRIAAYLSFVHIFQISVYPCLNLDLEKALGPGF